MDRIGEGRRGTEDRWNGRKEDLVSNRAVVMRPSGRLQRKESREVGGVVEQRGSPSPAPNQLISRVQPCAALLPPPLLLSSEHISFFQISFVYFFIRFISLCPLFANHFGGLIFNQFFSDLTFNLG
ncbi:hypothetical protein SLA2020_033200 [Shorea laevis]